MDVGNEEQVGKQKKKYELIRERELADLHYLISIPQGCRVLWRLLDQYKLLKTISHHDPYAMATASGYRDAGLWLLAEIDAADNNGYMKLFKESKND